jgi:hypothetical protein
VKPAALVCQTRPRCPALLSLAAAAWAFASIIATSSATLAQPARAAETHGNSLDWVPADASFYAASFHLKDQVDRVAASNAWKAFRQIPSVAMAWSMAEAQINNPAGPAATFWQVMALPENKQLAQVGAEMVSDEIVVYAGANFSKLLELYKVFNNSRFAQLESIVKELDGGDSQAIERSDEAQLRAVLAAIKKDPSLVDVPEITFAFHVKDAAAATTQLARLEIFANMALQQSPIGAKFERRKIGESEYLVLYLDGSMIPWPEDGPSDEDGAEAYEAIKEIVSKKKLYISIGVWSDYVVLSINHATDHLAKIGEGAGIGSRKEFASLAKHKDRTLVGAQYASEELISSQALKAADLEQFASQIGAVVNASSSIPDELKSRIAADLNELTGDFKKYLPTPGAAAGYTFLNDDGYETYRYNWSDFTTLDSSKALELTNHLGGSPILAVVARGIEDPAAYDAIVKWTTRGYGYFKEFALPEMDEDERLQTTTVLTTLEPFVKRFDRVMRDKFIPALKDGQSGLLLDADITSKKWQTEMPASHTPLPMLELGIVVGVSDAKLLTEGMADCRTIINDALKAIEGLKLEDDYPAGLQFPAPVASEGSDGTVYTWSLPAEAGLDDQIVPATAVGEHVAVFATSRALAERALAERELTPAQAALDDADQARATVAGINWAELMSAVEPWVIYGVRSNFVGEEAAGTAPASDPAQVKVICDQIGTGFKILRCFEGAWGDLRKQDGVWVTHSVSKYHDLAD